MNRNSLSFLQLLVHRNSLSLYFDLTALLLFLCSRNIGLAFLKLFSLYHFFALANLIAIVNLRTIPLIFFMKE